MRMFGLSDQHLDDIKMNRAKLVADFSAIVVLSNKIDANQQKVNFMHYMHGRAEDAHHWQNFVDNQRVRVKAMLAAFDAATASMSLSEKSDLRMEAIEPFLLPA